MTTSVVGYYYLHVNGALAYKPLMDGIQADMRESDLVVAFWPIDPHNREGAWTCLVEALAAGANPSTVFELAQLWKCSEDDARMYAKVVGCKIGIDDPSRPTDWYATRLDFKDLQASPSGWGDSPLEAMAELCKELGYRPAKTWGRHFKELLFDVDLRHGRPK